LVVPLFFFLKKGYNRNINGNSKSMGLFSGFPGSSSRITPLEFHDKVRVSLRNRGLTHDDIQELEGVVKLSLEESGIRRGLDRHEVDAAVAQLRQNRHTHRLSDDQIDIAEEVMNEHL
jgi:hypothetical protein